MKCYYKDNKLIRVGGSFGPIGSASIYFICIRLDNNRGKDIYNYFCKINAVIVLLFMANKLLLYAS